MQIEYNPKHTYKIISNIKDQFYCKKCKKSNDHVYLTENERYCDNCVPSNIKEVATKITQTLQLTN